MPHYLAFFDKEDVVFNDETTHHLKTVLRVKLNEDIKCLIDNEEYQVKIISINPLKGKAIKKNILDSELKSHVRLFLCLFKGEKYDWVLQKACELGVSDIHLVQSKRTIVKIDKQSKEKKLSRYQKILDLASGQCLRKTSSKIIDVINLKDINKDLTMDINLLANEKEKGATNHTFDILNNLDQHKSISCIIGPEGGFDDDEILYLKDIGFESISLGKRILRSDTASLYLLSVISFCLEK